MDDVISGRLADLGATLHHHPPPRGQFLASTRAGDVLHLSGKTPRVGGQLTAVGRLGAELSLEEGVAGARTAAINALSALEAEVGLERILQILKWTGYVASADGFVDHPAVIDGASAVLTGVLGTAGGHARTAIGVASLPGGALVELDLVVQVR